MGKFDMLSPTKQKAVLLLTQQINDLDAPRKTYDEIAAEVGVDRSTLHRWRTQDADFAAARLELIESYKHEIAGDAFAAIRRKLQKGDMKAAELALKSTGALIDRKEVSADVRAEVTSVADQDTDAMKAELESLRSKLGVE